MRNMLALAALLVIVVAVIGYHRNWYTIQTEVVNGQRKVTVDIDNKRVGQDIHEGIKKSESKIQDVLDGTKKTEPTVSVPNANQLTNSVNQVGTNLQDRVDQVGAGAQQRIDQVGTRVNERVDQVGTSITNRVDQFTNEVTDRAADKITDKFNNKLDQWLPKK